jgi:hypothetical protein
MKKLFLFKEFRVKLILFSISKIIHFISIWVKTEEFYKA